MERDLLILRRIHTSNNFADSLTKPVGKDLHYRHNEYLLEKKYLNTVLFTANVSKTQVRLKHTIVYKDVYLLSKRRRVLYTLGGSTYSTPPRLRSIAH